jgi:hypothetical protein
MGMTRKVIDFNSKVTGGKQYFNLSVADRKKEAILVAFKGLPADMPASTFDISHKMVTENLGKNLLVQYW